MFNILVVWLALVRIIPGECIVCGGQFRNGSHLVNVLALEISGRPVAQFQIVHHYLRKPLFYSNQT